MLSRSTPEYAVRRMVSAISSAMDSSVLRKSSKPMGSRGVSISDHLPFLGKLDDDVAVDVERRARTGRDHGGRVVLFDDHRPFPRRDEVRAVDDGRLAPAEVGAARTVRDPEADDTEADDLDRLVLPRAVTVGPLMLAAERLVDAVQQHRVEGSHRHRYRQLERLAFVATVRGAANPDRVAAEA